MTVLSPPTLVHVPRLTAASSEDQMRRRTSAGLWLTLAFWGSNYVLLILGTALSGHEHLGAIAAVRIMTTILGLGFCYLIHLLLSHHSLSTTKRRLIALAIVAPIAAETFAWASFFAEAAVDPTLDISKFTWSGAIRTISFWTWFFLAWAGLYLALMYSFDVQEEQRRTAVQREEAHVAQLRALHSQINPHFLFNSLNSVSALILDKKTDQAEAMVVKLAQFLRLGLAANPTAKIPLSLELELQRSYLEIEQVRFPDLSVEVVVPDAIANALVPALILQPLVENAVKYGVAGAQPPTRIAIQAVADAGDLILEVVDSGRGKAASSGAGIGLENVRQRLTLLYDADGARLTTSRAADGSFHAQISLPLER